LAPERICREPFAATGEWNVNVQEIEGWLVSRISVITRTDPNTLPLDRPFVDFGIDSSVIVTVTRELSHWLGKDLSITVFWEFPTIAELARSQSRA
jgi:acyl carrier protein